MSSGDGIKEKLKDPRPGPALALGDFKRAFKRFQADQMTDRAAGLTYYSLLSLFPALLFGIAALGFFGQSGLITDAADYLRTAGAPAATVDAVTKALESAQSQRGTALTALIVALGTSLYGASGAFGAVGRALNLIWRVEEGRGFIRKKLHDLGWPAALVIAMLIYAIVYFAAPNVDVPHFQFITPGALVGVFAWIIASAGFFLYV